MEVKLRGAYTAKITTLYYPCKNTPTVEVIQTLSEANEPASGGGSGHRVGIGIRRGRRAGRWRRHSLGNGGVIRWVMEGPSIGRRRMAFVGRGKWIESDGGVVV